MDQTTLLFSEEYSNGERVEMEENVSGDESVEYRYYRQNRFLSIIRYFIYLSSFGMIYLMCRWKVEWNCFFYTKIQDRSISFADYLLIIDKRRNKRTLCKIEWLLINIDEIFPIGCDERKMISNRYSSIFQSINSIKRKKSTTHQLFERNYPYSQLNNDDDDVTDNLNFDEKYLIYYEYENIRYIYDRIKNNYLSAETILEKYESFFNYHQTISDDKESSKKEILLSEYYRELLKMIFNRNELTIPIPSIPTLLIDEVLNPYYIFQIASVILWSLDNYYLYASCIIFISIISIVVSLIETRRQRIAIRDMVSQYDKVKIMRKRLTVNLFPDVMMIEEDEREYDEIIISSVDLVKGDIIILPHNANNLMLFADCVLLDGTATVDESMLTGESTPEIKFAYNFSPRNMKEKMKEEMINKKHILFAGTTLLRCDYYRQLNIRARVIRTGFVTIKGNLVRSILHPDDGSEQSLFKDSTRFITMMFALASIGMVYSVICMKNAGENLRNIILRTLDIITIVVPPALPAAMTIGTYYAQARLKKKRIFSISPSKINRTGKIKLFCFDKTGTLTADGLSFYGVLLPEKDSNKLNKRNIMKTMNKESKEFITYAMATCHTLSWINNKLVGDPLDLCMFNEIEWKLVYSNDVGFDSMEPTLVKCNENSREYLGIARQFPFNSALQRMTTICKLINDVTNKNNTNDYFVFVKGSPEKIIELCELSSVPLNYVKTIKHFYRNGLRLIAFAMKILPDHSWNDVQTMERYKIETNLKFLGLLCLENPLKEESEPIIQQLYAAAIPSVMVTGDSLETAVYVADRCQILREVDEDIYRIELYNNTLKFTKIHLNVKNEEDIDNLSNGDDIRMKEKHDNMSISSMDNDHVLNEKSIIFVLDGMTFSHIINFSSKFLQYQILTRIRVMARMSPDEKKLFIDRLKLLDYVVGMCGDGANDCGALKAADAGISLSESEASIAAPFTCKRNNIICCVDLICEGRASLTTTYAVFKYMALYSIIQFVSILILYTYRRNLSDTQFLYIDLIIVTLIAIFMGRQGATNKLIIRRPSGSLMSIENVSSIMFQVLIVILIQIAGIEHLLIQNWYFKETGHSKDGDVLHKSLETTTIFLLTSFQYIIVATIFSRGHPYREPIYRNYCLIITLIFLIFASIYLLLFPYSMIHSFFNIHELIFHKNKRIFRFHLFSFVIAHLISAFLIENYLISQPFFKRFISKIKGKTHFRNRYKRILNNEDNVRQMKQIIQFNTTQ
ncbi:hypothetical protein SNEBB_000515 [Seison nebaliae]|nr:hypothetical protein SNEBB_000515 [Seison nebaliae]